MKDEKLIITMVGIVGMTLIVASAKRISSFAGPYRVEVRRVINARDESTTSQIRSEFHITPVMHGRAQYVWGSSCNDIEFNDDMKGSRFVHNQSLNFEFPQFPIFPYGHWLFRLMFKNNGSQTVGAIVGDVDTLPKL